MFPPVSNFGAYGSFRQPVLPPVTKPQEGDLVYIGVNCEWLPYIVGALTQLLLQSTWIVANDNELIDVWGRVSVLMSLFNCATAPTLAQVCGQLHLGQEVDFDMPIRVDCDCNVFITCCDGTEKQLLTADQVQALMVNGGTGTKQPTPGGGCQDYHINVPAGSVGALIPAVLNTGDTIALSGLDGVWYGGSVTWYTPEGFVFFAGPTPAQNFSGSSQMPAVPIGKVILLLDGVYYDTLPGPFTVPGGVSNKQGTLLMNTDTPSTASGQISLNATVCNNQPGTWRHVFDLATQPGPFTGVAQTSTVPVWTPGIGWTQGNATNGGCPGGNQDEALLWLELAMPTPTFISTVEWAGSTDTNNGSGSGDRTYEVDGVFTSLGLDSSVGPFDVTFPIGATVSTSLGIRINSICFASPPNVVVNKLVVTGTGTDPF